MALAAIIASVAPLQGAEVLEKSPRPAPRPATGMEAPLNALQVSTANQGFQRWIEDFRSRALSHGIAAGVFDTAFQGVRYNADVIERDRNQSEFTKTIWDYLDSAASETRIGNGREALTRHRGLLDRIEARYGVDKEVVVAIWGLESAYGEYRGRTPIVEALATLAYDGRRGAFFEDQLIAALKIVQSGDTDARHMTGSWAGAMGHTQFIPTSYLAYAVDFTGDGRRDIWSDDPADALASTAAYLARFGWKTGQPWGVEVQLPRAFDHRLADRGVMRMPSDWAALGVRDMDGRPVPDHGRASILLPAGARGAAFMIFDNFAVIERYNTADAYVIGVGHLSDRIRGGGPIRASWPRGDRALLFAERKEMQERLTHAGFDTRGVDGKIGPNTIAAVRAFQRSVGMIPDGYASLEILRRLR
ncbi:lytic murein transglycosylase [Rhodovulum euryhalinum]|uniref:Membrane-bound lytic murein transglycosylase B n=1 Tax=Rhodovulum euryhalinum TaxID=35805 RepID=A0A4R2KID5_9RHOB|nr:membrane-bound lytic murein transglycosylase B [Rhodovulum euryhalinum]